MSKAPNLMQVCRRTSKEALLSRAFIEAQARTLRVETLGAMSYKTDSASITLNGELWRSSKVQLASQEHAQFITFVLPCGRNISKAFGIAAKEYAAKAIRAKLFDSSGMLIPRLLSIIEDGTGEPPARRALIVAASVVKPRLRDSPYLYIVSDNLIGCAYVDYSTSNYPEQGLAVREDLQPDAELQIYVAEKERRAQVGTAMLIHARSQNYSPTYSRQPLRPRFSRFMCLNSVAVCP